MIDDKQYKCYDTLFLVINERDGVVSECQRQLYEASLIGIDRAMYCYVTTEEEKYHGRLGDIQKKLDDTCEMLKIRRLNTTIYVLEPFYEDSMIVQANDNGWIKSGLSDENIFFGPYKEDRMGMLQNRERIGKVLTKS